MSGCVVAHESAIICCHSPLVHAVRQSTDHITLVYGLGETTKTNVIALTGSLSGRIDEPVARCTRHCRN